MAYGDDYGDDSGDNYTPATRGEWRRLCSNVDYLMTQVSEMRTRANRVAPSLGDTNAWDTVRESIRSEVARAVHSIADPESVSRAVRLLVENELRLNIRSEVLEAVRKVSRSQVEKAATSVVSAQINAIEGDLLAEALAEDAVKKKRAEVVSMFTSILIREIDQRVTGEIASMAEDVVKEEMTLALKDAAPWIAKHAGVRRLGGKI